MIIRIEFIGMGALIIILVAMFWSLLRLRSRVRRMELKGR